MKYDLRTMFVLVFLFLISQIIGLGILYKDMEVKIGPTGAQEIVHTETVLGPRPEIQGFETFVWLISATAISTVMVLIIVWLKKVNWWKSLFFISVFLTIALALGTLMDPMFAFTLAFIIAIWKIYRPNAIIHNVAQVLMFSGIAVLLVPLFDLIWIVALLIVISLYDVYAVYKSKHMVKMALFQVKSKLFAGITLPLKKVKKGRRKRKVKAAIIGGGDVAFPLLFAGVVMENLIKLGLAIEIAFLKTLIIPIIVSLTLIVLFLKGGEGKFYPGMPFLTAGCLIAYLIILLV